MLYKELVERLRSDKKYEEAAHILINYLQDFEEAVISLCNGKHWTDAVRIAHNSNCLDLIGTRDSISIVTHPAKHKCNLYFRVAREVKRVRIRGPSDVSDTKEQAGV